jgi:uncharacterized SAM-binding protein YcdF (DUF218 family)
MAWISYSSLVPPNLFILLAMLGVLLAWRWTRLGLAVATIGTILLYLASLPVVADCLIWSVETLAVTMTNPASAARPEAIVVLSGDYRPGEKPGEPDTVGPLTLERLAEAAYQQRRLGLPVLVSGGRPRDADESLARLMSTSLERDFGIPVRWREERSGNTYENAAFSAEMLRQAGIRSALVVTHPWHMARALWSFRAVGFPATPATLDEWGTFSLSVGAFFPQVTALLGSYYALHELFGLAWYQCRYGDW